MATVVMALSLLVYFFALRYMDNTAQFIVGYIIPSAGAGVASYIAPRNKFNVGVATVFPAIILMGIGFYLAGRYGSGDFLGGEGTVFAVLLSAPIIAIASVFGALLGEWLSKENANA
jgi:hypothetical protein